MNGDNPGIYITAMAQPPARRVWPRLRYCDRNRQPDGGYLVAASAFEKEGRVGVGGIVRDTLGNRPGAGG